VAPIVAETSITIPGIRYVIDTGLARMSQYNPRSRTTSLPIRAISKSSADQRKGRCGRVQNGICIRLFDAADYEGRSLFTEPEILRSNLAEVILRMLALNLGDISSFPFIDSPNRKNIKDGIDILKELGAIETGKKQEDVDSRYRGNDKTKPGNEQ
jgi:ATP-dependent helicase HrpA